MGRYLAWLGVAISAPVVIASDDRPARLASAVALLICLTVLAINRPGPDQK
ncbi:hypothetical protein DER29_4363 [Micromonospora sp. M71_S20]|uniref:hypothetical protein n=1 Tax=Micromonospora sp. M71_S20 TaxID=592872 RepID=UPI000F2D7D18|nr:hypothetical protein [Micromonospora sp. M71_S20]RLK13345.1 hypothetical protein DER29_4363 [Micromonospora sp. M71_S20]